MSDLPNIPTPVFMRLREYRYRFLPPLVFIGVIGICALVWRGSINLSNISGVGEGIRSTVTTPQAGMVQEVKVSPFQVVSKGQALAVLLPVDPKVQLDMLRTELQLAQMRLQPSIGEQNALDFERMRMEILRLKSELAIAQVNLERTENESRRTITLFNQGIVSEFDHDLALKTRDAFKAEVEQKRTSIGEIEARMGQLRVFGDPSIDASTNPLHTAVAKLELAQASAATNWQPITLVAPISGMVTTIARQPGEYVAEGQALIIVNGLWSERVVAYLRQPYPVDPEVGLAVQVTTRTRKRQIFTSEIAQIGAQLEIITNSLGFLRQGAIADMGLPIVVNVPREVAIRPGETVDVLIKRTKAVGAPMVLNGTTRRETVD